MRFIHRSKEKFIVLNLFSLFIILLFFFYFSKFIGSHSISEQCQNLSETVRKDIVHCYALEGRYPDNITYLEEHYGLVYDKDSFYIDYIPFGENIMPDFTVLPLERQKK